MISIFKGKTFFLSNFYMEPDFTHVEGEYQAAKCAFPEDQIRFAGLSPREAKWLGRRVELREDWDRVKIPVMHKLVRAKFTDHPDLAKLLLSTKDEQLVEGNDWGDRFWGVCKGIGQNHLGRILMAVRAELRRKQ